MTHSLIRGIALSFILNQKKPDSKCRIDGDFAAFISVDTEDSGAVEFPGFAYFNDSSATAFNGFPWAALPQWYCKIG